MLLSTVSSIDFVVISVSFCGRNLIFMFLGWCILLVFGVCSPSRILISVVLFVLLLFIRVVWWFEASVNVTLWKSC